MTNVAVAVLWAISAFLLVKLHKWNRRMQNRVLEIVNACDETFSIASNDAAFFCNNSSAWGKIIFRHYHAIENSQYSESLQHFLKSGTKR